MAGLHPSEFKLNVESKLDMKGHSKDKLDEVFDLVWEVAIEWRTVERADEPRHPTLTGRPTPCGKPSAKKLAGKSAAGAVDKASNEVVPCFK